MTNMKEVAWIAGLLEGEGTFYMQSNRYLTLQYGSSDLDIVYRVAGIMKSHNKITEHKSKFRDGYIRKRHYRVTLSGILAAQWMMTIYPLMGVRRKAKIKEILIVWKAYHRKLGMSKSAVAYRLKIKRMIKRPSSSIPIVNPFIVTSNLTVG